MVLNVPSVKFNNGLECPILGLGTWKAPPGVVVEAVGEAIKSGYRHFDCAYVYQNEKEVGQGLAQKMKEGVVQREDLFVTSKLWNTFHRKDLVIPALKRTLADLGLNYLDLYLIHWPMGYKEDGENFPTDENGKTLYSDTDFTDTWKEMENCVKAGLVKSIGLSNFNRNQIQKILDTAEIKPVTNQVESHPYLNQKKLIEFCKSKGITITAYSPLGSPDRPWAKPDEVSLMSDPKIISMASKYSVTSAQLLIRYQIERGVIVIPKSVTKSRIESNIDVFQFSIDPTDMETLNSFDCNNRMLLLSHVSDHKDYPFNEEF